MWGCNPSERRFRRRSRKGMSPMGRERQPDPAKRAFDTNVVVWDEVAETPSFQGHLWRWIGLMFRDGQRPKG